MKKILLIILITSLLILPIISAKNIEVIIEHKNPQAQKSIASYRSPVEVGEEAGRVSTFGARSISVDYNQLQTSQRFQVLNVTEEEFELLKQDSSILIQENIPKHILLNESVPLIEADAVWNIQVNSTNITGESQTICILDTGAQTNHPYLTGKNATCNIDCATNPGTCIENCSATDPNGHGTHVAGIITSTDSTIHGVTQSTKFIPLMVCNASGTCFNSAIYSALDWCMANKDTYNITVISMSLGGGQYDSYCDNTEPSLRDRINNLTSYNISVVAATGNLDAGNGITNNSAGISSPACMQNAIRIGNTDQSDNMANSGLRHSFFTDIITAPGVNILSTYPTDTLAYSTGTSMSTPHVSGIISLLNQFKKLETNSTLTPSEIRTLLFNSGKTVYDSITDTNFSRVNAYQTILASDEIAPEINAITPEDNLIIYPSNVTFTCNSTDNLKLENITLQIFNETGLFYNITNSSEINISVDLSGPSTYTWNCIAYDNASNYNITSNRTISHHSIITSISTPQNNTYTNQNKTTINCSVTTSLELTNITLYAFSNDSLFYNETQNISGSTNYTLFTLNATTETNYNYFCIAYNNESYNDSTENYTITYDKTLPQISLTSPANNTRTTTKTHTFTYSKNETNPNYCNLTLNGIIKNSFTQTLTDGTYTWSVNCTDKANNTNSSNEYTLTIYTETSSSGGGGGGSSSSTPKTYTITEEVITSITGAQQKLKEKESVSFKIKSQTHKITLNKIENNKANVTIESDPITIILEPYKAEKINLDNDNTLDLELILLETNGYANIQIKQINETIPQKYILPEPTNKTETTQTISEEIQEPKKTNWFKKLIEKFLNLLKRIF